MTEQVQATQVLREVPQSLQQFDNDDEDEQLPQMLRNSSLLGRRDEEMKDEDSETVNHGDTTPVRRRMHLRPRDRTPPARGSA